MLDTLLSSEINFDELTDTTIEELKSQFNYNSPKSIEELKFGQQYNKWFANKQIGNIANGRLQVSITPLNEDLSLNTEKVKYLHTSQIKDLCIEF